MCVHSAMWFSTYITGASEESAFVVCMTEILSLYLPKYKKQVPWVEGWTHSYAVQVSRQAPSFLHHHAGSSVPCYQCQGHRLPLKWHDEFMRGLKLQEVKCLGRGCTARKKPAWTLNPRFSRFDPGVSDFCCSCCFHSIILLLYLSRNWNIFLKYTFHFGISLDLQKSCKDSTKSSSISLRQFSLLLTAFLINIFEHNWNIYFKAPFNLFYYFHILGLEFFPQIGSTYSLLW